MKVLSVLLILMAATNWSIAQVVYGTVNSTADYNLVGTGQINVKSKIRKSVRL